MTLLSEQLEELHQRWDKTMSALHDYERQEELQERISLLDVPMPKALHWSHVQLCRQMCISAGFDPDAHVVDTNGPRHGPFQSVLASQAVPAWTLYEDAARAVIGD